MDICSTFSNFLQERAILTQRQAAKLGSTVDTHEDNQSIFKLADFFRSLTPSDCYDLALRLFLLWSKESEKPKITPKTEKGLQKFVDFLTKNLQKSALRRLRASVSSPRPQQLSASVNKHRSISPVDSQVKSPNSFASSDVFEFLHNEAQRKNYIRFQNEQRRIDLESQSCTFQPNSTKSSTSIRRHPDEVFERLQQDLRREKQEINDVKKFHMEMKDCTFTPHTTKSMSTRSKPNFDGESTNKNSSLDTSVNDRTFDRLYKHHNTKRQASIENEFKKRALEVKDCTFQPSLTARNSQRSTDDPDRYNKLYKMHAEKQRNLMKKRIDKSIEEESKYSFRPSLISPAKSTTSRGTSKDVRERLLEWNHEKKKKLENKLREKVDTETNMHNELNLPAKKMNENYGNLDESRGSVSTFQRLYQDNQSRKQKKEVLEKRVLREIGASFTPKTNVGRNSSAKKEQGDRFRSLYNGSPDYASNANMSREEEKIKSHRQKSSAPPIGYFVQPRSSESDVLNGVTYKKGFLEQYQNNLSGLDHKTATFGYNM